MPSSVTPPGSLDTLDGSASTHTTRLVSVRIWWLASSLMASEVKGHLDVTAARFLAHALRDRMAKDPRRLVGFHDWTGVTNYDGNARIVLTQAARESSARSDGTHVLALSALVHFGLRTADFLLGNIHSYVARAPFEAAMQENLRRLGHR